MKDDFRKHDYPERAQLILPKEEQVVRNKQFDGSTTYATEFTKKRPPTPTKTVRAAPLQKQAAPFGTTTVQDDYKPHRDHQKQRCFKPRMDYQPCKVKFDGQTTASIAYRKWPLPKREKGKPHECTAAQLQVDNTPHTSCYQADYKSPSVYRRPRAARPQREELTLAHKGESGDGQPKTTQYREHFVHYQGQPLPVRPSLKQSEETRQRNKGPFQAKSIYQDSYRGEPTERAKKYLPYSENEGCTKDAKMTFMSTYKDTFKGKQPGKCPTSDIIQVKQGQEINIEFQLVGTRNGHQIYRNVKDEQKSKSPRAAEVKVMNNGDCDQSQSKVNLKVAAGAAAAAKVKADTAGQKRAAAPAAPKSAKVSRSKTKVESKRLTTP